MSSLPTSPEQHFPAPPPPSRTKATATHSAHTPQGSMNHLTLSPSLRSIGSGLGVLANAADKGDEEEQAEAQKRSQQTVSGAAHELAKQQAKGEVGGEGDSSDSPSSSPRGLRKRRSGSTSLAAGSPHIAQFGPIAEQDEDSDQAVVSLPATQPRSPKYKPRTTYIAPHLRGTAKLDSSSSPSYALKALSLNSLDHSALPESEDNFYASAADANRIRSWKAHTHSLAGSFGSASASAASENDSPRRPAALNTSGGPGTPQGASRARLPDYFSNSPPSPVTLISRGPYTDPAKFAHPPAIEELTEDEDARTDGATWGIRSRASSAGDSEVFVAGGKGRRGSAMGGIAEEGEEGNVTEEVCTSCGTEAVASFVALMPCDHLLCHQCVNALINAAAHKPPRVLDCFFCGGFVESFAPAWEGVGVPPAGSAYAGDRIGLVEALYLSCQDQREKDQAKRASCREAEKADGRDPKEGAKGRRAGRTLADSVGMGLPVSPLGQSGAGGLTSSVRGQAWSPTATSVAPFFTPAPASASDQLALARSALATGSPTFTRQPMSSSMRVGGSAGRRSRSGSVSSVNEGVDLSYESVPGLEVGNDSSFMLNAGSERDGPMTPLNLSAASQWNLNASLAGSLAAGLEAPQDGPIEVPDWPIVRLDNIPWDVSVAEVEDWLPEGSLPPPEQCVLAVHVLCNRADGRTLNQCYVEAASLEMARLIVRSRDGRKLRNRPVHVTLNGPGEFLNTIFPTYDPGFTGAFANRGPVTCPILMQTELTGLLTLCKMQNAHASKVQERPFFNVVTIIQKFPWYQPETYNSQQIVRLFNTACAAAEILSSVRAIVPDWLEILTVLVECVMACPVFRTAQKTKFLRKAGIPRAAPETDAPTSSQPSFAPPSLADNFLGVGLATSTPLVPGQLPALGAPEADDDDATLAAQLAAFGFGPAGGKAKAPSPLPGQSVFGGFDVVQPTYTVGEQQSSSPGDGEAWTLLASPKKAGSGQQAVGRRHRRSSSSIARELGVDQEMIRRVAEQLGMRS